MNETASQQSIEPLLTYFTNFIPLKPEEKEMVEARFQPRLYRKRQFVLQEGNVCAHFNFVVRGCLRLYKIDDQGNIHILQFASENHWINDLGSFHSIKPSLLNIDAIEDTVVLQITHDDLIALYKQSSYKFDRIFRVLVENGFIHLQNRLLQNISSTAEERYASFLELYPHLVNRLSQVQIASFLGISPEFLSRLRNKKSNAGKSKS